GAAEGDPRELRLDLAGDAAELGGGAHLGVEELDVRRAALEEEQDDGPVADGLAGGGAGSGEAGGRQAAAGGGAGPEEGAAAGVAEGEHGADSILRGGGRARRGRRGRGIATV